MKRDEEIVEHAKKKTDLILQRLAEQQHDPDPELLRKMKWTKDDLKDFVNRWDEMKKRAESGDEKSARKYERHLKSLNLRPKNQRNSVKQNQGDIRGLNQDGGVTKPSDDLLPDYNSFMKDLNRVRDN
ncbi:MAG: hypothetical protein P8J27_16390 [Mariniblastus sp.]|nr:hypothetical protein [Mariniblastus sp.]